MMLFIRKITKISLLIICCCSFEINPFAAQNEEHPLYIGWSSIDITPDKPVALVGQLRKRISENVLDPLTATALALETRSEDGQVEQAIMISCDVIGIRKAMQDRVKDRVREKLDDFDADKLFMNATHTHTAPGFVNGAYGGLYDVSEDEGVMKASEYGDFFVKQLAEAAVNAWKSRKPAGMSWGLGHAVVGHNRRAVYFDGTSRMYGNTAQDDFSRIEGYEDHAVELLYFWDSEEKLTGVVINIACPSQETEGMSDISADFWHDVRVELRKRFSDDLYVFPQCAAAGDISPHLMYRKRAEQIMVERRGLSRRQEIARRIADAVEDVHSYAKEGIETNIVFEHTVAHADLPPHPDYTEPFYKIEHITSIEFHVLRLGEIAIATNPFELYIDYGLRMKARSPAILTFLVQLSCQSNGYLPTEKAIAGGGYSADKFVIGPKGGQVLVDETVRLIREMWD